MSLMNMYGRVAVCGSISSYNDTAENLTLDPPMQPLLVMNQLKVEGFFVWRWLGQFWSPDFKKNWLFITQLLIPATVSDRWEEGLSQLRDWKLDGKLKAEETVAHGFENLPNALTDMLAGQNRGKMVVKKTG